MAAKMVNLEGYFLEGFLMENASYTRLQAPTKSVPYKQFVIGLNDNSEMAVSVKIYKSIKNYLGGM